MTRPKETGEVPGRLADPAREVALSAVALLAVTVTYTPVALLVGDRVAFDTATWLLALLCVGTWTPVVVLRARDARRRRQVCFALAALLAVLLVPAALFLQPDVDVVWDYGWLFEASGQAAGLLVLTTWGLSRRHGRWWWFGLLPAYGLVLAVGHLHAAFYDVAPEWAIDAGFWAIDYLVLLLGAAACWLVDVVTTRPRPRAAVAVLEHEHA